MTEARRGGRPSPGSEAGLPGRFAGHLRALGAAEPGHGMVVAVSGGVDSLVLLHLLRFGGAAPGSRVVAAHLDHRMRPESSADALWLRGLARAWNVPLEVGEAERRPTDQASARQARYRFLERVRRDHGARWILTAHHRDDQAETVLHRILRGTGPSGLRGIRPIAPLPVADAEPSPPRTLPDGRQPVLLRPLLPFPRDELEAYARRVGVRAREDPTNRSAHYARNVLRREILPRVEEAVAPGAREALVRLAALVEEEETAWEQVLHRREEEVVLARTERGVWIHRARFLEEPPAVQRRLLRWWMASYGVRPHRQATEDAQRFGCSAASGRRLDLPRGLELRRDFHRLWLGRAEDIPSGAIADVPHPEHSGEERPLSLDTPARLAEERALRVGGRTFRVRWDPSPPTGSPAASAGSPPWTLRVHGPRIRFPLRFRGWRAGDRVRLRGGRKTLAKAFGERRVPREERGRVPVLVDAHDEVLWVPGVLHGALPGVGEEGEVAGRGTEGDLWITVVPENDPGGQEPA